MHRDQNSEVPAIKHFTVPKWKQRRWELFKRYINTPEIQEHIRIHHTNVTSADMWTYSALAPIFADEVPEGCVDAFQYLLAYPDAPDEELVSLIDSPVKYISHVEKVMGPSNYRPQDAYNKRMHKFREIMEQNDMLWEAEEALLNYDHGVYLKIDPYTTPKEIISFVEANYDKHLQPLLRKQSILSNKQPEQITKRGAKLRSASIEITRRILALNEEGKRAVEVMDIIYDEYGKLLTPEAIHKRISRARQRKKS